MSTYGSQNFNVTDTTGFSLHDLATLFENALANGWTLSAVVGALVVFAK